MKFNPLIKTRFKERPNRFILLLEREDNNEVITAHLPDPGRLKELLVSGAIIWVEHAETNKRKTAWTAMLCETSDGVLISLKTTVANQLVETALRNASLPVLSDWSLVRKEYTINRSRFDFLLEKDGRKLLLEVKSVTLGRSKKGYFPDAATKRGLKHVQELIELVKSKEFEAAVLFVAQRQDIESVEMEATIDPDFAQVMSIASKVGVSILGISTMVTKKEMTVESSIPVIV